MSTSRGTWKAAERRVADFFGTVRQRLSGSSGRADETASDTKHDQLFIEAKYRQVHSVRTLFDATARLAKKEDKVPVVVLIDKGKPGFLICVREEDLQIVADWARLAKAIREYAEPGEPVGAEREVEA